jgi:hypothetical protein
MRGTAFGLFQTSLGLVSLPAPAIGAQLWERFGPRTPFSLTAWLLLLSAIPAWRKFRLPANVAHQNDGHQNGGHQNGGAAEPEVSVNIQQE